MTRKIIAFLSFLAVSVTACGSQPASSPGGSTPPQNPPSITAPQASPIAPSLTPLMEGKLLFARCKACHTLEQGGKHLVGPNLYDTVGKAAAQKKGFVYSKAMASSGIIWTDENLSEYLASPATYLPKNRMIFVGLRNQSDRDKVILYLKSETMPGFVVPKTEETQTEDVQSEDSELQAEPESEP